jgi:hypothetical protein
MVHFVRFRFFFVKFGQMGDDPEFDALQKKIKERQEREAQQKLEEEKWEAEKKRRDEERFVFCFVEIIIKR